MNIYVIFVVVMTIMGVLIFEGITFLFCWALSFKKGQINPIDICVYDLLDKGHTIRYEKGRFELDKQRGKFLCTVGFGARSIKDKMGYGFSDNNLCISKNGWFGGRKFIAVAAKDGLFAPMKHKREFKKLNLSKDQLKEIEAIQARLKDLGAETIINAELLDNPESLSLTPIKSEQLRFSLDTAGDAQDIYMDKDKEFAKTLIKVAISFGIFIFVMSLVVIIILIMQGPGMASSIAASVAPPLPPG